MSRSIRIGSVAGVPVEVSPWWFLVAGVLTLSVAPYYESWFPDASRSGELVLGAVFVALLYGSAFLHELGHLASAKAFGLRVHRVELTALGGLTQMDSPGTPLRAAVTSVSGPLVNAGLALVALLGLTATAQHTLPHLFAGQLVWTNALLAAFNLLPGLPLDGGAILRAGVWKVTGRPSTGTVVAAWGGRAVAVLMLVLFARTAFGEGGASFGGLWTLLLAFWLWSSATAALGTERVRAVVPRLSARALARPVVTAAPTEPVSVMLQRIATSGARGAVVVDSAGSVTGIVSEAAVAAAPEQRRPWITAGDVSRRLQPDLDLDADLAGDDLMRALAASPAPEYLVRSRDGVLVGVLAFVDVEAALRVR